MSHAAPPQSLFASDRDAALTGLATATSAVPVVGDLAGLAADANMYAEQPESRNWKNYLLTGLGALPFVPAVAAMGRATRNVPTSFGNETGHLAFHGSQKKFDRFSGDKLGTGEGVQRFGPGHYLAEEPGVAGGYRQAGRNGFPVTHIGTKTDTDYGRGFESILTLDADEIPKEGLVGQAAKEKLLERLGHQAEMVRKYGGRHGSKDPAWSMDNLIAVRREILDAPDEAVRIQHNKGYLYKVDVPDEIVPRMLDWDKPLREQPHVLKAVGGDPEMKGEVLWNSLVNQTGDPMAARKVLEDAGIPGIRYYDQGSRGKQAGTRNMVVFKDDHIRILNRENADDTVDSLGRPWSDDGK